MTKLVKNFKLIGFKEQYQDLKEFYINDQGIVLSGVEGDNYEIVDLHNNYLSPGWIDLHTHIYYGVSNLGVNPDLIGPQNGVTVLVDAGSAGEANFLGFKKYIIKPRRYPIYSFINLSSTGLIKSNKISELNSLNMMDLDKLFQTVENNREYIKGLKLRASGVILQDGFGREIVKLAKVMARELSLPLMVHVGEPLPLLEDILPELEPGDIVTHIFHGKRWGIYRNGEVLPEFKEAIAKGVKFDLGHGAASFNFDVAIQAFKDGYRADTISTDLHTENINGPVWDLALTMSKLYNLGLSLEEIIAAVSQRPAEILKINSFQNEFFGMRARFTVFEDKECKLFVYDSNNNELELEKYINPLQTIIGTEITPARTRVDFKS
jgi:dihydroorotase